MASMKTDHYVLDYLIPFLVFYLGLGSQDQVTYTWNRRQWIFQALPQGYLHSPTICHRMVAQGLEKSILPEEMAFVIT